MLAYVFWHRRASATERQEYERRLMEFHEGLAGLGVSSASFTLERLPFGTGGGYEDWYLVEDWNGLGLLGVRATSDAQRVRHETLAPLSGNGWGGIYALVKGEARPPDGAIWVEKARAESYDSFLKGLAAPVIWQRQLALGPAPEFCLGEPSSAGRRRLWPE